MTAPSDISPRLAPGFVPPLPDAYSRFVAMAKRLLPLLAVGLLILVVVWPRLDIHFDGLNLVPKTDPRLAHDLRMLHTRYSGIDRENRPFVLTADAAEQLSNDINDLIGLEGPKADMTTTRGGWFESSAYTGTYQPQSKLLDLFGEVALYSDRGDEFHTDSARVDLAHSTEQGDEHITGQGPFGHVVADGFRVLDRGATIIFTGRANLVLEPTPRKGAP
jgi:lipopolysaccharide export system protein LptC